MPQPFDVVTHESARVGMIGEFMIALSIKYAKTRDMLALLEA